MTPLGECAHRDVLVRAYDIADGRIDVEDVGWLMRGFKAYLASDGTLPLERCLHLPTGDRALRRARRDSWLRQAWDALGPQVSPWRRSEQLAEAVNRFRAVKWPRWRVLGAAPEYATPLEQALYEAFRSHERIPSTAMQIHNIALQRQPDDSRTGSRPAGSAAPTPRPASDPSAGTPSTLEGEPR